MNRSEVLKNLLKCIFENYTLSVDNGEIVKGVSMLSNCNYTVRSFNNFKNLFEIAFIVPNPRYSNNEDFDRKQALSRAKEYLLGRGIDVSDKIPYEKQCEMIFEILRILLYAIVVDKESDSKDTAKDKDISSELDEAINQAQSYFNQNYVAYDSIAYLDNDSFEDVLIDTDLKDQSDNCNYYAKIDCSQFKSFAILRLLRNLYLTIPLKESDTYNQYNNGDMFLRERLLSGKYTDEVLHYACFPIFFFHDNSKLYQYMKWGTYIYGRKIISKTESSSIHNIVTKFCYEIASRANEQVERKLNEDLKPFYENNRERLEHLITSLTSLKGCEIDLNDTKVLTDQETMKEFLFDKCIQVFWDFERPYRIIEQTYHDNVVKGLYIAIQNTIIELTELLNEKGEDIARQFKLKLTTYSFRRHKNFIKKTIDSDSLKELINLEKNLASENEKLFSEPTSIKDFFYCIRKNSFYNFQSALYKYHGQLTNKNL